MTTAACARRSSAADPVAFFGPEHAARYGADPGLLVKLLDAGERLPVHFHPGPRVRARALGSPHGKTEAWIVVSAAAGAAVRLGFREDVTPTRCAAGSATRTPPAMLAAMHELPVAPATRSSSRPGAARDRRGSCCVELQEPTDLSVLLEWRGFGVDPSPRRPRPGLGPGARGPRPRRPRRRPPRGVERAGGGRRRLLPAEADPYFRAERVRGGDELDAGFSILVALAGEGTLAAPAAAPGGDPRSSPTPPARALGGDVEAIRRLPPDPRAGERQTL